MAIRTYLCISSFFIALLSSAQQYEIRGRILDAEEGTVMPGATVFLINQSDTLDKKGTTSDRDGAFRFPALQSSKYTLRISYVGYKSYALTDIAVSSMDRVLPDIFLPQDVGQLGEVLIVADIPPVQIKGDTIEYNADAYKVHPDASAEDLVKKMPGVTAEGNALKINGEEVKKILVDGQPFFSDDPNVTLKNLPADMIGNVQIFDQQSDQSRFTGFDDGNREKTINLSTKKGMNTGQFGKVYGGYGTDNTYKGGFTFNRFNGSRRISLIGMSNNINEQNFSISDIMSVMNNSGSGRTGPPGMGGSPDFFTGQQNGITGTHALGFNYNDTWGKKIRVSGNYFFNLTNNVDTSRIFREYYTQDNLQYMESSRSETDNTNHRFNFKFEYVIDSVNKLTITPRLTYQQHGNESRLTGQTISGTELLNNLINTLWDGSNAHDFNNDVLYQHAFQKKGRTISLNVNTELYNSSGDGSYYSLNEQSDSLGSNPEINQQYTSERHNKTLGANLSYTEPAGKNGQWMISYQPSLNRNTSERLVYNAGSSGEYSEPDTALMNVFDNTYTVQRGGIGYRLNTAQSSFSVGVDAQEARLEGNQTYPESLEVQRTFFNVLPSFTFNHKFDNTSNLNVTYRASTEAPSISRLQNYIDQSSSLFVRSGNPYLRQSYQNNLRLRFMKRVPEKELHFITFINATQTNDYVGNSTTVLHSDTIIQGVALQRGSQYIIPHNLNGYYNVNAFGAFGFPVKSIKSNLSLHTGYGLTNTPALINDELNYALNHSARAGFYLGSNISEYLDFSLAYNGSYNTVSNSLQTQSNSTYLSHAFALKANYILLKRVVMSSDVNQYYYTGLSSGFNQRYTLWNASLGYKFLKNRALEMKLSVYDLLNQNTSISQNITETYTEESQTQVLNRYFMLTLTYTFKKFKAGATGPNEMKLPKGLPPPDNMSRPPGM